MEGLRGPGIDVFGVAVAGQAFAENNPHQVIRTGFVVVFLHGRGNLVVGLGYNLLERSAVRVVAPSLKWIDKRHKGNAEL